MSAAIFIITIIAVLGVPICLHELGHLIAAKRAGVKVEEFGIGMPPRLLGIQRGDTTYSLNAIPIGGFVKTAGADDPTVPRGLAGKGPWTRLRVSAAGPLANILSGFVLISALFALPVSFITGNGLMVHSVAVNSSAEEAGIKPGDIILKMDGQPVRRWEDMHDRLHIVKEGADIPLLLARDGQEIETTVKPKFDEELQQRTIGVLLCWNMVSQVEEDSVAYKVGIRPGDIVVDINGQVLYSYESMSSALRAVEKGAEINLLLLRDGNNTVASLTNLGYETLPGVQMRWVDGARIEQERLPVWRAVYSGAMFTLFMLVGNIVAIPALIAGPDGGLVGPIGIGHLAVEAVGAAGFSGSFILFMAGMISLGIAMFNLLPVPPLDGGGMLIAFIEGLRHGKRLPPRAIRLAYIVGTTVLIVLVVLVVFRDVFRLIVGDGFGL